MAKKKGMTDKKLFRLFVKLNIILYRMTGGWIGAHARGLQHLLITTTGAKTGIQRTQALVCLPDDEKFYVVASNGGGASNPAWWYNLEKHPDVMVQFFSQVRPMTARTLSEAEKSTIWQQLISYNKYWGEYQETSIRSLPVVELTPS